MKNILFLLSILLGQPLFCHAQRLGDFLGNLVAPLDKTEISSNFLWDKGLNGLAEPAIFDGILRDSLVLQPETFGFLYAQARNAFVGTGINPLPQTDVYMNYVKRYTGTDTIPLAALALRYHRIHKDAVDSNLLRLQNQQLFDVPGRSQSPYWQDTLFAFAPLKTDAWHTTVHFTLPAELIWQNLDWPNPSLQGNFDDGQGWQTLTAGQTYTIEYDSGGVKTILTRIQQGSTILEGQSILFVAKQPAQERGEGPNYPIDNPEAVIAIPGGGGDLRIFYGSPCNKLTKPFIIVEGFELTDNPAGFTNRLRDLLRKPEVITGSSMPFGEWLYDQGYDIVWVNLFDIQDDIRDNAEVLKAAVQKINQIKAANGSSEPNMIMGVSAGGIITKYMLAKTNAVPFDHQCEKFFSYDAPLRGANIPVSIQCFLQHANYIASTEGQDLLSGNPKIAAAYNVLTSPFARQTLLYRFYYPPSPSGSNDGRVDGAEHEAFMAELDALGGIPIRHIALSNGSPDNTTRANIFPGSRMFEANTSGSHWTFIGISHPLPIFLEAEFNVYGNALSNEMGDLVYYGNFSVKADGIPLKDFPLSVDTPEDDKSYDTAPGGSSVLALSALGDLTGTPVPDIGIPLPLLWDRWITMSSLAITTYATHYCFIPTRSAISAGDGLALNGPFSCGQGSSSRCTMSTEDTPLPAEYGVSIPEMNQDHVFLDARIGDVLVDELDAAHLIPGGLLPSYLNTYYNAGLPVQSGIPTVTISSGSGQLSINNSGRVGYSTGNEPVSPANLFAAYTKCNAIITVENGAKLVVGADGGVKHGVLNVNEGSIVHIKSGGILYVTSNSSHLVIKHGAKLILDPGAIVRLESPGSSITINGDLVVNGDIIFGGPGFFGFGDGNRLVFGPGYNTFNLAGMGKDQRFVQLGANVEIDHGHRLNWSNGRVEVGAGLFHLSDEAGLDFTNMTLNGGGDFAIEANGSGPITLQSCTVEHLAQPIVGVGGAGCNIFDCAFSNIGFIGVDWTNALTVRVKNSVFTSSNSSSMALNMVDVPFVLLDYSQFSGYGTLLSGIMSDGDLEQAIPAVNLSNTVACMVKGCTFNTNAIGIKGADPNNPGVTANVLAFGGSSFTQNSAGIFVEGTQTTGTVLADCVTFDRNTNGIRGRDIALMIDSENSKIFQFDTDSPNMFINDGFQQAWEAHVRICYGQKDPGGSNLMRNNAWRINNGGILMEDVDPVGKISLQKTFCSVNVPPVVIPVSSKSPVCILEQRPASFETPFPGSECMLAVGDEGTTNSILVHEQFHLGAFLMKADSVEAGIEALRPVAALWQPEMSSFPDNCQQYIRVAKAFVDASDQNLPNLQRPNAERANAQNTDNLLIAPNPANNSALLQLSPAESQLTVWNPQGKRCFQAAASGAYRLETATWQPGIYFVEAVDADGRRKSGKLVVQR